MSAEDLEPNVQPFSYYIDAFLELSSCRQIGLSGEGPIPFTAIVKYFEILGNGDNFDDFLYFMRIMDNEYLLEVSRSRSVGAAKANKNNQNTDRRPR